MKALCYHGAHDIRYDTVDDPVLQDENDVIVRVNLCSICGSDLHIFHGEAASFTEGFGFCVGHEAVGEVVETGTAIRNLKAGDRVMVPGSIGCGACSNCIAGNVRTCLNGQQGIFGLGASLQGSQAEAVRVPMGDANLGLIPESVSDEQALMMTDAQATAWFACKNADISDGHDVVIVGLGPIGLMCIDSAFALGAKRVFAIDPIASRRELAQGLGAMVFEPEEAYEQILEATIGFGADSVIEAVGADETIAAAIKMTRREGTVSVIGVNKNNSFPFPMGSALTRGLTFRIGATSVAATWPQLIPRIQEGKLNPAQFITNRVPLSEGLSAYHLLDSRADGVIKAVIKP